MKKILMVKDRPSASGYYRAVLPAKYLDEYNITLGEFSLNEINDYDIFMFYRPPINSMKYSLEAIKNKHKTIIYDLDDDYWNIPAWNPFKQVVDLSLLDEALNFADWITTTTEELAEIVKMPEKTRVLPNLIDVTDWMIVNHENVPIRIGWAGSICHSKDIDLLVNPIEKIIDRWGTLFHFMFFGDLPEKFACYKRVNGSIHGKVYPNRPQISFIEPVEFPYYPNMLANLGFDIGLCPLTFDPFNLRKSNLKYMEYTLSGACTVKVENPYDSYSWLTAIEELIDPEVRKQYLQVARLDVLQNYSWQHAASKWKTVLDEVIS